MGWLTITVIAALLHPSADGHGTHQQLGLPPCPSVLLFDRPCPGCGLTTSWTAFVHGSISQSFRAHPLGPISYALYTLTAIWGILGVAKGVRLRTESNEWTRVISVGVSILIGFGLIRMAITPHYAAGYERQMANAYFNR